MKKRLTLALQSIIMASAACSYSVSAETLQEIYVQARQNNHAFQAAKANLAAGEESKSIGRSALLPQISGSASWSEADSKNNLTDTDTDVRNQSYSISLRQNLIKFDAWYQYQGAKIQSSLAAAEFVKEEQDLILRTANAYFDALKAVDTFSTAKAEEEALAHRLEQTKQRFEVGLTAITEVHEAQAVYDSATASRLEAEGRVGIAFEALEVLTGQPYLKIAPLKTSFPVLPPEPKARSSWEEWALANNIDLKIAEHRRSIADESAKAAKSQHLPSLTGSISYGNNRRDVYQNPYLDSDGDEFVIGLNLNVPIYSGGGTSASRRQAVSQALSAKELYLQAQRSVVQSTRATHLSVLTTVATVKARKQAITSSRSALEATQAGYDVGTRDLVDVLNAQRNLYVAQRNYFDALYSYVIATLQLKQAAGVLSEQDVADLDSWLDLGRTVDYVH